MSVRNRLLTAGFFLLGVLAASPVFSHVYQFRVIDADTGLTFYETDFIAAIMGDPPPYRAGDPMTIRVEALDQAGNIVDTFNRDVTVELRAQLGPGLGQPFQQVTTLTIDGDDFELGVAGVAGVAEVDFTPEYAGTRMMRFRVTDGNIVTDDASSTDPSRPEHFPVHPAGFAVTYVGGGQPLDARPMIEGRQIFARVRALNADGTTASGWDGDVELMAENDPDLTWSVPIRGGVSDFSHEAPSLLPLSFNNPGPEKLLALAYETDPFDPDNWDDASPEFEVIAPGENSADVTFNLLTLEGGAPYPGSAQTVRYQIDNPAAPDAEDPAADSTDGPIDTIFELVDPGQNNLVILRWFEQFAPVLPAGENSGPLESTFVLPENLLGNTTTYHLRARPITPQLDWETIDIEINTSPDLRIARLDYVPGEHRTGDGLRFHLSFWNAFSFDGQPTSAVPDGQDYRLQIHLSVDGAYGNEDDFLVWEGDFRGNRRGNRLVPGEVIDVVGDIMLPNHFEGTYNLLARINSAGGRDGSGFEPEFVDESVSGNNTTYPRQSEKITLLPRQATETFRVSETSAGGASGGHSDNAVVSFDGRYVAFESRGALAGVTDGSRNIFVRNVEVQNTILVSQAASPGAAASGNSGNPSISDDGRYVVFQSNAGNLVPGDTNGYVDVFIRDIQRESTQRLSVNSTTGQQGNHGSQLPRISGDGRFVVFESSASNLTNDDGLVIGRMQIYLYDRQTNHLRLVSGLPTGLGNLRAGASASTRPTISEDGRYVVFVTSDREILGLPPVGPQPFSQVVRWDRHTETFAPVTTHQGELGDNVSGYPAISGDGRHVAFASRAQNLTEHFDLLLNPTGDQYAQGIPHVFRAEFGPAGEVQEILRMNAWNGREPNHSPSLFVPALGSYEPTLSRDGQLLSFTSESNNLLPPREVLNVDRTPVNSREVFGYVDTNFAADVYLFDLTDPLDPAIRRASVSSFGYGTTNRMYAANDVTQFPQASRSPAISPDGRFVAFTSATKGRHGLIFGDTNYDYAATNGNVSDIYVFDMKEGLQGIGHLPEVTLLMPQNLTAVAGTSLRLAATGGTQVGSISFIEFYVNGALEGVTFDRDFWGQYILNWQVPVLPGNPNPVSYTIAAIAVDSDGLRSNLSNLSQVTAQPALGGVAPTVEIVSPTDGLTLTNQSSWPITATAVSDEGRHIDQVEFFIRREIDEGMGISIGMATSGAGSDTFWKEFDLGNLPPQFAPYTRLPAGRYAITAVARDSMGNMGESAPVVINVQPGSGTPLDLTLTANKTKAAVNESIRFDVQISEPIPPMEGVSLYANGVLLADLATGQQLPLGKYWTWSGGIAEAGVWSLHAVATDSEGNRSISNTIEVDVSALRLVVSANQVDLGAEIGMELVVLGGTTVISYVDFFVNGVDLGVRDSTAPFRAVWKPAAAGVYQLTAVVRDSQQGTNIPVGPVTVTVQAPVVPPALSWKAGVSGTSSHLNDVHFYDDRFLAVGQGGTILESEDGDSWSPVAAPSTATLNALTSGFGHVIGVGDSGTAVIWDGQSWELSATGASTRLSGVAFGDGMFVAVGDGGRVRTLSDVQDPQWMARTSVVSENLLDVTYADGRFVAVGQNGRIISSPNGIDWTASNSETSVPLYSVTHGNGLYLAVGGAWSNSLAGFRGVVLTSPDAVNWAQHDPNIPRVLYGVTFAEENFTAVGGGGEIALSNDGVSWLRQTTTTTETFLGVDYGAGVFAAVGRNGTAWQGGPFPFQLWLAEHFAEAERDDPEIVGVGADPGGFGIPNLIRYALALDPRKPDPSGLPVFTIWQEEEGNYPAISFTRKIEGDDILYGLETSGDLLSWDPVVGAEFVSVVAEGDRERVVLRSPTPLSPGGNTAFLRLRLTLIE